MSETITQRFKREYPQFFESFDESPHGCICIGEGWEPLLKRLCDDLVKSETLDFQFVQIKQKWGGICLYSDDGTAETEGLIDAATWAASGICEDCGTTKNVTTAGDGYVETLCDKCRDRSPTDDPS